MKKLFSVLVVMTLCCSLLACGKNSKDAKASTEDTKTEEQSQEWEQLTSFRHDESIYATQFFDKEFGIGAGYKGVVVYTTDGGTTWAKGENESMCRFGVEICSKDVAYTCGNGGNITKTTDGGKTWSRVTDFGDSEPTQCQILSFISESEGMVCSQQRLAITKDGGQTWTELKAPANIVGLQFLDEEHCYIVDDDSTIYFSKDQGQNWDKTQFTLPDVSAYKTAIKAAGIYMNGDGTGNLFVISKDDKKIKGFTTEDDGKTWTACTIPEKSEYSFMSFSKDGSILTIYNSMGKDVAVLAKK